MARELSYVMVNPYTIYKSRTGGVLSRLLTRTALDLVGAIMFAPSREFVDDFAAAIVTSPDEPADDRLAKERIREYVREHYAPAADGRRNRFMALLFEGEDAVRRTRAAVGNIKGHSLGGETIRDTYGDFILNRDGSVRRPPSWPPRPARTRCARSASWRSTPTATPASSTRSPPPTGSRATSAPW